MRRPQFIAQIAIFRPVIAVAVIGSMPAVARLKQVPLPPARPSDFVALAPGQTILPSPSFQPTADDNDNLRGKVLASGHVDAESLPPIIGEGGCGIAAPLRLDAIVLADGAQVTISPPAIMRASLASVLADWLREDLAPAVAAHGDQLAKIAGTGAYECRTRDGIAGAKLSEHAIGNALDLQAFVTLHGESFAIAGTNRAGPAVGPSFAQSFLMLIKTTACRRFKTVLGPGSDSFHVQHLHVDLETRRYGGHLCQWSLPPLTAKVDTSAKP